MKILVVGGYDPQDPDVSNIRAFATALGRMIAKRGHTLLGGCMTEFDSDVAQGAHDIVGNSHESIISYVLAGSRPAHRIGRLINSQLTSWDPGHNHDIRFAPEPIHRADVVVLVRGFEGTNRAAFWAQYLGKPIVPVAYTGGSAREIYNSMHPDVHGSFRGRIELHEFENLNAHYPGLNENCAEEVIQLAERAARPRKVIVIMSYTGDKTLENYYEAVEAVCQSNGLKCERVNQTNTKGRLIPRIMSEISHSAFVVADLTNARPNVLYELGFAHGIQRESIVTAKEETILPFDIADVPCTFWDSEDLKSFKEALSQRVRNLIGSQSFKAGQ